jgi:putative flippase GtrA
MSTDTQSTQRLKGELLRFLVVGGIAVALDAASYWALMHFAELSPVWAKRASFGIGSVWAFFANKYFTFAVRELSASEPVLFAIVYLAGWFLNSVTHDLTLGWFGMKWFAFLAATGVSTCSNFIGQKFLVFRRKDSSLQS